MIRFEKANASLSRTEALSRLCAIGGIATCAVLLRAFDPVNAHSWLPLSCGAVTGVPCIFCGTTRALHCLLNGDFSRALYFNWIAFPVAMVVLFGVVISVWELMVRQRIVRFTTLRMTPRSIGVSLATIVVVWTLQVWLAVSQHKSELLNPRGPLYALLVGTGT